MTHLLPNEIRSDYDFGMATLKKTKGGWQAQVARTINGKLHRKAETHRTKREAQTWANEYEANLTKGATSKDTLAQVFDRYARERTQSKKGAKWELVRLERFKRDLVNEKPLGDFLIGSITTADLVAWRDARLGEVQPASVRREMNLLKHVFSTATDEWELIPVNPMKKVSHPAPAKRRTRRISQDEIDLICAALDMDREPWVSEKQITGAAFLFAIETAMRSGEILAIRNRDVSGRVVTLPETKNDHPREVPLTDAAADILDRVRNGDTAANARPFNLDAVSRDSRFRAAVKKAGITDLHFHDTRHEATTRLARRLEVLDLARVTGHKNLNELMTYYEASGEELAARLNASTSSEETK